MSEYDDISKGECYRDLFEYLFPIVVLKTSRDQPISLEEDFQDMELFPDRKYKPLPSNKLLYKSYPGTTDAELDIVRPNFDTSYIVGYLDTKLTPVIITVPEIKDIPDKYGGGKRFWGVQMMDAWTNTFKSVGLENNDSEGSYIVTGPTWRKNNKKIRNEYTPGTKTTLLIMVLLFAITLLLYNSCVCMDEQARNKIVITLLVFALLLLLLGNRKWRQIQESPTDFVFVIIRIQTQNKHDALENTNIIQRKFRAELYNKSAEDALRKEYEEGMIVPTKEFIGGFCKADDDCDIMNYCNKDINICKPYDLKNCRSGYDCPTDYYCDTFEPNDGIGQSHECKPIKKCDCKDTITGGKCTDGVNCECGGCGTKKSDYCDWKTGACLRKENEGCLYDTDCGTGYCKYNDNGVSEGGLFKRGAGNIATCQQPPCMNDDQCEITGICDFQNKVCATKRKDTKCDSGIDCTSSETCSNGICKHIKVDHNCDTDLDCPSEEPRSSDGPGFKSKKMYCDTLSTPRMCKYQAQSEISIVDETRTIPYPINDVVFNFTSEYFYTLASWLLRNIAEPPDNDNYKLDLLKSIHMIQPDNAAPGLGGFSWKDIPTNVKENLIGAFELGKDKLTEQLLSLEKRSTSLSFWTNFSSTETVGIYGVDYSTRALLALEGLGANPAKTAVYLSCRTNSNLPLSNLNGVNDYFMVFDCSTCGVNQIKPPVDAFWSLTVYDKDGYEVDNSANITHVGSETNLKYEEDGRLILTFSNTYNDKYTNWVPIPKTEFSVLGRFYLPTADIISGTWSLPVMETITNSNCDDDSWAGNLTLPSCSSIGYPDGISMKNYYLDGRYPITTHMDYIRQKGNQLTNEQKQCMIDPKSKIQPLKEDRQEPVTLVRDTISRCLNNIAPADNELTIWDTKGLINPKDKVSGGNNECPLNSDTCCAVCDKGQPCANMEKLIIRSTTPKNETGWKPAEYHPDILTTMEVCDLNIPTSSPEDSILYKMTNMLANDEWFPSAIDTLQCKPRIQDKTTKACIYDTKDGNSRGVPLAPSSYYNNSLMVMGLGGYDLVGNMPACYNNLSDSDKKLCGV